MNSQNESNTLLLSKADYLATYEPIESQYAQSKELFKDYAFSEMFVRCFMKYNLDEKTFFYNHSLSQNLSTCFLFHPQLTDLFISEIDFQNKRQIDFAFKEIVATHEKYALFLKKAAQENFFHIKNNHDALVATAKHKVGRAYLADEYLPLLLKEHYIGRNTVGFIVETALIDSYFAIKVLGILFAIHDHKARLLVMRRAVANNEQFAIYILNLPNPSETTWFPDYSKNHQTEDGKWLYGYENLEEEMYALLCVACSRFIKFAQRHVYSENFKILLAVSNHPSLHSTIVKRRDLSNEVKANLIRERNNKKFAEAFKDVYDIFVLREVLSVCPELSTYIIEERTNLSVKQKNWLRYENKKIKNQRDREYVESLQMDNRSHRYNEAVDARMKGRRFV